MTKQQTTVIMAKLSAFYGQGKSDPKMMTNAWHEVLRDYDFLTASNAVTQYAKHDMREYATFPTVGVIVDAIRKEEGVKNRIFNSLFRGCVYQELHERAKEIITEEQYLALVADQETLREKKDAIMRYIDGIYRGEAHLENNDQRDSTEHEQIPWTV